MRLSILLVFLTLSSCSSFRKVALRGASPIFTETSKAMTLERDWDFFRESSPGNLKFLEMLYYQDTENLELLASLIKGFAGYAYAVPETLALGDDLSGVDGSIHRQNAISFYTKSLDFGLSYFDKKGIKKSDILDADEQELTKLLNKKLSKKDYTAALFMAQSWGSLINLQKDNIALVSHIPKVKGIIDWVCAKEPEIEDGICDMFYAQYEASRPKMLGGDPVKAKRLFDAAIKKRPKHLLIRMLYVQFMILPSFDSEAYEKESLILKEELAKWSDLNRDNLDDNSDYKSVEHLNLFNAITKKRFELIEMNKKKIFQG